MPLLLLKPASLPTCALTSPQQSQTYFYLNWPKLHVTNASEGSEQCPGFWWDLCCITTYLPVSLPHKSQTYFYLYLHISGCQLDLSCILQQCAPKSHLSYLLHASEYCTCPCICSPTYPCLHPTNPRPTFTYIFYTPATCESTWTFLHSPDPQVTWATSCLHMSATWLCFGSQCIAFVKVTALPLAYLYFLPILFSGSYCACVQSRSSCRVWCVALPAGRYCVLTLVVVRMALWSMSLLFLFL